MALAHIFVGQSRSRPGQSHGFQAKPGQQTTKDDREDSGVGNGLDGVPCVDGVAPGVGVWRVKGSPPVRRESYHQNWLD